MHVRSRFVRASRAPSTVLRVLSVVLCLGFACEARAQVSSVLDTPSHALQLGLGGTLHEYHYPAPGVRGDLTWLRRYNEDHGYFLRLEGSGSIVDAGDGDEPEHTRAYTATLMVGVREWLGPRKRGFVEVGLRAGVILVTESLRDELDVYLAKELIVLGAGVALGRHHDVDLMFSAGWGFPGGAGFALRVPLFHRYAAAATR